MVVGATEEIFIEIQVFPPYAHKEALHKLMWGRKGHSLLFNYVQSSVPLVEMRRLKNTDLHHGERLTTISNQKTETEV